MTHQRLNHDVKTVVIGFIDIVGRDACSLALVSREWYKAMASGMADEWLTFQKGFGFPRHQLLATSSGYWRDPSTNFRSIVTASLKAATNGQRDCLWLAPESYDGHPTSSNSQQQQSLVVARINRSTSCDKFLIRTGHLTSSSQFWRCVSKVSRNLSCLTIVMFEEDFAVDTLPHLDEFTSLTSIDFVGGSRPPCKKRGTTVGRDPQPAASTLPKRVKILDDFMTGKSLLTSINLSGSDCLSGIVEIGDNFLKDCIGLVEVDISGLCSVRSIGFGFMCGCARLKKFATGKTGLNATSNIGTGFLWKCHALTSADLSGLTSMPLTIGRCFMKECRDLPVDKIVYDNTNPELKTAVESASRYW